MCTEAPRGLWGMFQPASSRATPFNYPLSPRSSSAIGVSIHWGLGFSPEFRTIKPFGSSMNVDFRGTSSPIRRYVFAGLLVDGDVIGRASGAKCEDAIDAGAYIDRDTCIKVRDEEIDYPTHLHIAAAAVYRVRVSARAAGISAARSRKRLAILHAIRSLSFIYTFVPGRGACPYPRRPAPEPAFTLSCNSLSREPRPRIRDSRAASLWRRAAPYTRARTRTSSLRCSSG